MTIEKDTGKGNTEAQHQTSQTQSNDPRVGENAGQSRRRNTAPSEPTKSEAKVQKTEEDEKPQSYVWLANGDVVRAYDEDLPGAAGHGAPHGYWQKDGSVYDIVGVYPVEKKAAE